MRKKDMDGPADTRMMGIVHDALRRDLARVRGALACPVPEEDVLLPHLDREENAMMPVVSATITHRQWHDWDQAYNIKPKSLPQLAEEGLWLMEGLDATRRAVVEAEVPWLPRMIVLHGFGPGYRRRSAARWAGTAVGAAS